MKRLCFVIPSMMLALLCTASYASPRYNITDLGTLGGSASYANAINSNGWVVGYSKNAGNTERAFIWKPGEGMSDIGTLGGPIARAYDINDNGQVTGCAAADAYHSYAFKWSQGSPMQSLGAYSNGNTEGYGINNVGQVAGMGGNLDALLWQPGQSPVQLTYNVTESQALDINDSGVIVGYYGQVGQVWNPVTRMLETSYRTYATYWQSGTRYILPGKDGIATAINSSNQVAGYASGSDSKCHAYLWNGLSSTVDLGYLGLGALGKGINSSAQVVGSFEYTSSANRAFLWENGTGMVDLNTLVSPTSGWVLSSASDINDNGWIIGNGTINGQTHGFLLRPVPEPGSLLVLGTGLMGLLAFRRRNR